MASIEQMYIGSLLATDERPMGFYHAVKSIQPDDITDKNLQMIYKAIKLTISEFHGMPRPSEVANTIIQKKLVEVPEGVEKQAELKTSWIVKLDALAILGTDDTSIFVTTESVLKTQKQQKLVSAFIKGEAQKVVDDPIGAPQDKIEQLLTTLQSLTGNWQADSHIYEIEEQMEIANEERDLQRKHVNEHTRLMTLPPEWGKITRLVPDLRPGLLYVIKGPTKSGKSASLEQIADWLMRGFKVAYFGLEDTVQRKVARQACRLIGGTSFDFIHRGDYQDALERLFELRRKWESESEGRGKFTYIHCPGQTPNWIIHTIDRLQAYQGVDVVIVDYVQKLNCDNLKGELWQQQASAVELLKQRAEQEGKQLVMIVGSQETIGQDGKTWTRGGRDLEMKAQCVIAIKVKDAAEDEIVNGVTLAKKGDPSVMRTMRVEYTNDGQPGSDELMFYAPRFMFVHPAMINSLNNEPLTPTVTKPDDKDISNLAKTDASYRQKGAEITALKGGD